jgi:bifunctional non-homologous end joining protein LigD
MPVDLSASSLEPKWDGWRCLARIDGGRLRLTSRWRNDLTSRFPELRELPDVIAERRLLLDGELVALELRDVAPSPTAAREREREASRSK